VLSGEINGEQHAQLKGDYFESNRHGIFHYLLMVHEYRPNPTVLNPSSGLAEVNGDDVLISMGCLVGASYDPIAASTIMHELGHNFGLHHGGPADRCNYKPNHNSIMNYRYQFSGLDSNCDGAGDGLGLAGRSPDSQLSDMMSYSDGGRYNLDENHLDERVGMCGAFIDWNKNFIQNILQSPFDINRYHPAEGSINYSPTTEAAECGGEFSTLRDYNEWGMLNFAGVKEDNRRGPAELIYEAPIFELLPSPSH